MATNNVVCQVGSTVLSVLTVAVCPGLGVLLGVVLEYFWQWPSLLPAWLIWPVKLFGLVSFPLLLPPMLIDCYRWYFDQCNQRR